MQANSSGAEFLSTISKFIKRKKILSLIACLRPLQNVKLGIFTGGWVGGWMDGWMDGMGWDGMGGEGRGGEGMDGWMDGWIILSRNTT